MDAARRLGLDTPPARLLLGLLLLGDLALVVGHVRFFGAGIEYWYLDITSENGYGETYQRLKQGWSAILLALLWRARRAPVLAAWVVVAVYFLADDAFGLHEKAGLFVVFHVEALEPYGPQIFELVWMGGVGAVLVLLVALAYRGTAPGADRRVSWQLTAIFAALVVCGVLVDVLHLAVDGVPALDLLFAVAEDGGEQALTSVLVAYLLARVLEEADGGAGVLEPAG